MSKVAGVVENGETLLLGTQIVEVFQLTAAPLKVFETDSAFDEFGACLAQEETGHVFGSD
ncbi:hypothetical protein D3C78_1546150 [compost metagenome]